MLSEVLVNRTEMARRIAINGGYTQKEIEKILKLQEDVIEEAMYRGETVKHGKLYKLSLHELPEKECWDNFNDRYVTRKAVYTPKFQPLIRLEQIRIPVKEEDKDVQEATSEDKG
ncbi:DNA-binding protein [Bacillus phage vB_BthM-Goe5]|nr:DNA-binding protein [Bacillus phage vB_BthM-Goe5]